MCTRIWSLLIHVLLQNYQRKCAAWKLQAEWRGKSCKTRSILRLNPTILVITVHSVRPNSVIIKEFKVPLIVCFDLFTPRWLSLRLKKPRNYALHPVSQTTAHQQPTTAGWRWQCPLLQTARQNVWPTAVQLHTKLCGSKEELEVMAKFILQTGRQLRRKWKNKLKG